MTRLLVFAYYYLWYRGEEERRWETTNREYPPALGLYRSDDPNVIRQQLRWASEYGVDGFLPAWFGTASLEGQYTDENLARLREIILEFPEQRFAVFYDQIIRFGSLDFSKPDKREDFLADVEKIALDNFEHPNYWFLGDRPVVVLYLSRSATEGYVSLIQEARERMARSGFSVFLVGDEVWWSRNTDQFDLFDAVTAFNLHSDAQVIRAGGKVRSFAQNAARLYNAMQKRADEIGTYVIPGIGHAYNDEPVRSNLPLVPTWQPGEMPAYRQDMIYVIKEMAGIYSNSGLVNRYGVAPLFVNSFNEWPERTAIEPTAEIEAFNAIEDVLNNRRLLLPAPGKAYLEGIREARLEIENTL